MFYKYRQREYEIVSYDPNWKILFGEEAKKLKDIFGDVAIQIEHIGSTSVPGLSAKPTIDILVIVEKAADIDKFNSEMEALGYKNMGAFIAKDTRMFEKEINGRRTFIVHVFEKRHHKTLDMVKVKDYLVAHPKELESYNNLKKKLKEKFPDDYISYRKEKDRYMEELTKRALSSQ